MLQASPAFLIRARPRALVWWLTGVAAVIVAMVMVGGITRLTESGLSMTKWQPISGFIPPLTDAQWQAEFANYRRIPQYAAFNAGMTVAQFKGIFFWEFAHRLLARLLVLGYALPLAGFALRRRIPQGYGWRLSAILALLALQGAVGWWMVSSGLTERTEVSHLRLAAHLLLAMTTLAGVVWTALDLAALNHGPLGLRSPARLRSLGAVALLLLFAQLAYGAFTAGLRAGYAFASWPLMGDRLYPADVPMLSTAWRNALDNPIVVQFIHRWLAFAVAIVLLLLAGAAVRRGSRAAYVVVALVTVQIFLGIATLLSGVEIAVAVAHQANAALLVAATTAAAHAIGRPSIATGP